ncbi:Cyclic di-GMP phosphodiesterase Gmr [Roseibium album]|nr:Cyclic di-GMP phosphodiesterase Gmr [Roseibium album]
MSYVKVVTYTELESVLNNLQEFTWALRWRNPVFCKHLLLKNLKNQRSFLQEKRPLELNLAWIERWAGNFTSAVKFADEASPKIDKTHDPEGWAELLVIKSVCAYSLDDHHLADEIVKEGFDVLGSSIDCGVGSDLLVTLATLSLYAGRFGVARDHLYHALRIAEHIGLPFEQARVRHNLSRAELRAGDISSALQSGKTSIDKAVEYRNTVILPYAYEVYAAALVEDGRTDMARTVAHKGLMAAKQSEDTRVACQLHFVIGNSFLKEKELAKARAALSQGLEKAESTQYHLWARNFHLHLSQTLESMDNHKEALRHLKIFTDLQARLFNLKSQLKSSVLRSQLEYRLARHTAAFEQQLRDKTEQLNLELVSANQALRDLNAKVEYNALHDDLTGVGNRRMMSRFFSNVQTTTQDGKAIGALMIDLDGFKQINDMYGHEIGDQVLVSVARRLSQIATDDEALIRTGGDEFLVLTNRRTAPADLQQLAQQLLQVVLLPLNANGKHVTVGASVGVALSAITPDWESNLLRAADEAMYQAKNSGKNRFSLHTSVSHLQKLDTKEDTLPPAK